MHNKSKVCSCRICKGELDSIRAVKDTLAEFKALTGLLPSPEKSNIFFSGVGFVDKIAVLKEIDFKEGSLTLRHLGVPLITTKLKYVDCKPLVDRITNRINPVNHIFYAILLGFNICSS